MMSWKAPKICLRSIYAYATPWDLVLKHLVHKAIEHFLDGFGVDGHFTI